MFEVQKPEFMNKTFRLKKSLVEELSICAAQNKVSMNALVSQCCRYALDNMDESVINETETNEEN